MFDSKKFLSDVSHEPGVYRMYDDKDQVIYVGKAKDLTEALLLEHNFIKLYQPRYNVLLRDDKSYPFILLTKERHPRITSYRGTKKIAGEYFGPYPHAGAVRETLSLMQKLFPVRQCENSVYNNRSRPCLQYQIGR